MVKFGSITVEGGTVDVSGTMEADEGRCMRRVSFVLVQGTVVVEGEGSPQSLKGWSGQALALDLHPGPVTAVGVAVFFNPQEPPISIETRTWCQAVDIPER
jgi:hypothetical protein